MALFGWVHLLSWASILLAHAKKPDLGLGNPSAMACSLDSPARLFVGTELGQIAAMKMDGGYAQWQNKDHWDKSRIKMLKTHGGMLIAVSEGGTVHMVNSHSGATQWETKYEDRVINVFPKGLGSDFSTIVAHESGIQARAYKGDHEWGLVPAALGKPEARFSAAAVVDDGTTVCAILNDTAGGSGMFSVKMDARTGKVGQQEQLPEPVAAALQDLVTVGEHVAYIEGDTLSVYPICGSGVADAVDLKPFRAKPHKLKNYVQTWLHTKGVFTVANGKSIFLFKITADGLKHIWTEHGPGVVGPIQSPVSGQDRDDHVVIATKKGAEYDLKFFNVVYEQTERERIVKDHDASVHGAPWFGAACGMHKDMQINLGTEDHTLSSIKGFKPTWTLGTGHKDVKRRPPEGPGAQDGHFPHDLHEL